MLIREELEAAEQAQLAPWACHAARSRGRRHPISPDPLRTDFQRDRDRIIHCSAFRKLEFKTQVHTLAAGDYYRTRLTHTMEVAQIARTLARALRLNADLAEAIALCHDFGHTPFGHAGEDAMRACMKDHGGFEHNEQGLRTVELLEERYPDIPGLNLTFEVREGIIKHDTAYDKPNASAEWMPGHMATLESQIVDLADEIAYNNADLDDALKMGLIEHRDLADVPWVRDLFNEARSALGHGVADKYVTYRALGRLYDAHVMDVLTHTSALIAEAAPADVEAVRTAGRRLVDFSPGFKARVAPLKDFLMQRVYLHPETIRNSMRGKRMIAELFHEYVQNPRLLPWKYQRRIEAEGPHRVVCDYIAGMTDRFFVDQYRRTFLDVPVS